MAEDLLIEERGSHSGFRLLDEFSDNLRGDSFPRISFSHGEISDLLEALDAAGMPIRPEESLETFNYGFPNGKRETTLRLDLALGIPNRESQIFPVRYQLVGPYGQVNLKETHAESDRNGDTTIWHGITGGSHIRKSYEGNPWDLGGRIEDAVSQVYEIQRRTEIAGDIRRRTSGSTSHKID